MEILFGERLKFWTAMTRHRFVAGATWRVWRGAFFGARSPNEELCQVTAVQRLTPVQFFSGEAEENLEGADRLRAGGRDDVQGLRDHVRRAEVRDAENSRRAFPCRSAE